VVALATSRKDRLKAFIAELYEYQTSRGVVFRYGLLLFDFATVTYLIITSFVAREPWMESLDHALGVMFAIDFGARQWISNKRFRDLANPMGITEIVVIASLLAPISGQGFAFLRVVRTLRLLRSYVLVRRLRIRYEFFRQNEQAINAALSLIIFMFVMTALVYETQRGINDKINNYVDALYFTVTTLTTTGFGDITLTGTGGKLLAVAIMVFGVSLFLRLIHVLMRPTKVYHKCPHCGLRRHDHDAVHCKACGQIISIEDDGAI
jgi:voltage-gated potassium channel